MKTHLECIPCFIRQSLEAAKMATDDESIHEYVLKKVMNHLQNISFDNSPPELSREVHSIIKETTLSKDPYKKVKNISNENAKKLYPKLKGIVEKSNDPLLKSIQFAIVGNVIDFGTFRRFDINDIIKNDMSKKFVNKAYDRFKEVLENSKNVLYLADNTGEVFFDKLLLEELHQRGKNTTYVVKTNPIINDALVADAKFAGIDKLATIIEGDAGQSKSTPGILLNYASKEFLDIFNCADIVISKGQGNYESLSDCNREVFFLLMIKCRLVAEDAGVSEGSLIFTVNK